MPRVSQAHLDARRQQIVDAARRCFGRNGFHATSMQDVLAEAGLSAGAVYRYFPGKAEIIGAIAQDTIDEITVAVRELLDHEPDLPLDALMAGVLAEFERREETQDLPRLLIQVWGEALRTPALAEQLRTALGALRELYTALAARCQERGEIRADVPPEHVAVVLTGLIPGFVVQRAIIGDVDSAIFRDGLAALLPGHPQR